MNAIGYGFVGYSKLKLLFYVIPHEKPFSIIFQNFNKCYPGKLIRHKNIAGHIKTLVCAKRKDGVLEWQYTDGKEII